MFRHYATRPQLFSLVCPSSSRYLLHPRGCVPSNLIRMNSTTVNTPNTNTNTNNTTNKNTDNMNTSSPNTVDPLEIEKFSKMSEDWWNLKGDMKPLHQMNPTRVSFIRDAIIAKYKMDKQTLKPFENMKIVDIGCGAGILAESLARLGGTVVGIDAASSSIAVATKHASLDPDLHSLSYLCTTAEALAQESPASFDIITCLEVIEHVSDIPALLDACKALIKPGGSIFISTINRTFVSRALAVFAAENILRIVPQGTHDWNKFVTPDETRNYLSRAGFEQVSLSGMAYNPLSGHWWLCGNTDMNYICHGFKKF